MAQPYKSDPQNLLFKQTQLGIDATSIVQPLRAPTLSLIKLDLGHCVAIYNISFWLSANLEFLFFLYFLILIR